MEDIKRRGGPRLDLRLRVRFLDDERKPEAEATDISPGGARLETRVPLEQGSTVKLSLDAGDGEPVEAEATVVWCRERQGKLLHPLFDIGVRFEGEWLSQDRGKLGRALGRIFSFGDFEPARSYDRVNVTLHAKSMGDDGEVLTVVDLSSGGMQLRSEIALGERVRTGETVIVEMSMASETLNFDAEVMWVTEQESGGQSLMTSFGLQFSDLEAEEQRSLAKVIRGDANPDQMKIFLPA